MCSRSMLQLDAEKFIAVPVWQQFIELIDHIGKCRCYILHTCTPERRTCWIEIQTIFCVACDMLTIQAFHTTIFGLCRPRPRHCCCCWWLLPPDSEYIAYDFTGCMGLFTCIELLDELPVSRYTYDVCTRLVPVSIALYTGTQAILCGSHTANANKILNKNHSCVMLTCT